MSWESDGGCLRSYIKLRFLGLQCGHMGASVLIWDESSQMVGDLAVGAQLLPQMIASDKGCPDVKGE